MAKKLEGNGMWSSSRMMLPEHVEQILIQNKGIKRLTKPNLDEQEILLIDQAIYGSLRQKRVVTLTLFDEYELVKIVGTVQKVVIGIKQIKILLWDPFAIEDECVWIFMGSILKAELEEVEEWDEGHIDW
jgi:hypothetical protein